MLLKQYVIVVFTLDVPLKTLMGFSHQSSVIDLMLLQIQTHGWKMCLPNLAANKVETERNIYGISFYIPSSSG